MNLLGERYVYYLMFIIIFRFMYSTRRNGDATILESNANVGPAKIFQTAIKEEHCKRQQEIQRRSIFGEDLEYTSKIVTKRWLETKPSCGRRNKTRVAVKSQRG